MLNLRKYKEHCPNPTYGSFLQTDLRVYQQNQGHIVVSYKNHRPNLVEFVNYGGKWFAGSIIDGIRVNKSNFNYAMYIHHPLELINVAISNGHLLESEGSK
tara:strand:- start:641 stop:943 length:303 start_codon:yes stop_codon:yes gene_type:complete